MAITLAAASSERVDYGNYDSVLSGLGELSVVFTVNVSSTANDERIVQAWSGGAGFMVHMNGDEFAFITITASGFSGRSTSALNVSTGLYRCCFTWNGTTPTFGMYVNGSTESDAEWLGSNTGTITANNSNPLQIGYDTTGTVDCIEANYQEVAIYTRELSAVEGTLLSNGFSPLNVPRGLVFYSRLTNTADTGDLIGGLSGTMTGGTNTGHERMFNRTAQILQFPPAAAAAAVGPPNRLMIASYG